MRSLYLKLNENINKLSPNNNIQKGIFKRTKEIKIFHNNNNCNYFKFKNNLIILAFLSVITLSNEENNTILNTTSEITITIKGIGYQQILSNDNRCFVNNVNFNSFPNQIFINGVLQNYIGNMVYNLKNQTNNITMKWNHQLTNSKNTFYNLENITKIDLSKFDSSKVTDMRCMFKFCTSLKSIDFKNFNTSLVTHMGGMFYECNSIEMLDLQIYDTSNLIVLAEMFQYCNSLIYLNLNSFDTSKVTHYNNFLYNVKNSLIYCINETKSSTIISQLNNYKNNICKIFNNWNFTNLLEYISKGNYSIFYQRIEICNIKCNNYSLDSIQNNLCISCNNKKGYYPIINNNSNDNSFIDCYNNPNGFFLDNNIYKPCYSTCKKCNGNGDKKNHYCIECIDNLFFNTYEKDNNCYEKCNNYYYFDSDGKYHCTNNYNCPEEQNKLIINKNKCIDNCTKDDIYQYEYNNSCYENCPKRTSNNNYICEGLNCEICYNLNETDCLSSIPQGYFINNTELKTIDKCNNKCMNCSIESNENNLCISCNINDNYFPKYNDILNNNSFINCYNQIPDGYYLDNNIYKPCYQSCKNCTEIGNEENNKCIECKINYTFLNDYENDYNCYNICKYYYYFDSNKKYHCTSTNKCPNENNKLIKEKNKCIDKCINDDKYKKEYKYML